MFPLVPSVLKLGRQLQNCQNAALFSFYYLQETLSGVLTSPIPILVALNKESGLKTCNEAALIRLKWISNEVRTRNLATETCEGLPCISSLRSAHTDWFQVNYCISETTQQVYLKVFATKPSSLLQHINCPILWQQPEVQHPYGCSSPPVLAACSPHIQLNVITPFPPITLFAIRCRRIVNAFTTTEMITAITKKKESAYSINCCIFN
jgi:hypothetical protein